MGTTDEFGSGKGRAEGGDDETARRAALSAFEASVTKL